MTCMQYPSHKLRTQGPKFAVSCHGEGHRMPQAKDQKKKEKEELRKDKIVEMGAIFFPNSLLSERLNKESNVGSWLWNDEPVEGNLRTPTPRHH
ncbi:hypothetical protein SDJN03_23209, partial [Cucurbita argyrosperma subsp. sororia]